MRKMLPTLLASALVGACALATAGVAVAADPSTDAQATRADRRAEFQQRFFDKLDANHDGVVTRAEYKAWVDSRFDKMDSRGTGSVDANEIANSPAAKARQEKQAERFVKRYDRSGSGEVSKADFEAKEMARFDRLSGGADTMTETQFAAGAKAMHEQRRGRRGDDAKPNEGQ